MLPKITRGTLAEQVSERLLEYIDAQRLKPGDLLPSETSLASSFGVSRPVIREALKNLEGKGIVEIVNGKGALIRPIDSDPLRLFFQRAMMMERSTILELMEVRKGLEVQAAVLAAQRRDEKDLQAIDQIVRAMRANMTDLPTFTKLDVEFHLRIAAAAHNDIMFYLVESIRDALRNTISAGLQSRGPELNLEIIQQTHEALYETLAARDVTAAMHAMVQHFDEAISSMINPHS
jgi:GntR family transcriptional regulator, transcriptional repressor for pyruvate dehydrogenase complex